MIAIIFITMCITVFKITEIFFGTTYSEEKVKLDIAKRALTKYSKYSPTNGYNEQMGQDVGYDAKLALAEIKQLEKDEWDSEHPDDWRGI